MEFNTIPSGPVLDRGTMHSATDPADFPARDARSSPAEAKAPEQRERFPFLTKLVLISLLIPAYFSVGSLALSPSRLLFLVIVPILTINLLRGAYGRLLATDYLIFGFAAWMTLAMLANHTPGVAIEYTGSRTIVILGGYLTARATIRSKAAFVAMIRFLALAVLVTLPFALHEVITSKPLISNWLAQLPGISSNVDINHDPRLGLWRAQVVFAHPIHYGIFCSMAFSLVYVGLADRMGWFRRAITSGLIGLCCFFSVSSGPVLALAAQLGLIGWGAALRGTVHRWTILWSSALVLYIIAELASNRGAIYVIVSKISFSSSTAFARRILFNYGVDQIGRTPVFGLGYKPMPLPHWMTGSVDNFWLFVAVRFGMPAFLLLAAAFLVAVIVAGRRDFSADPELYPLRRAWIFTIVSLILVLATVAIWGELYSLVMFMLGSGMWFLTVAPKKQIAASETAKADPKRSSRYTRFAESGRRHDRGLPVSGNTVTRGR
ncbi:MAG: O-antigen ligase domain-containing protein [Pseudomonadota bacterium]